MTDPNWPAQQAAQQASQQQIQDEQRRAAAEGHRLAGTGSAPAGPRRIRFVVAIVAFVVIVVAIAAFIVLQFTDTLFG